MAPIKVLVHGALGKVGREVIIAASSDPATKLVGAVDAKAASDSLTLNDGSKVPVFTDLDAAIVKTSPDVIVDFSIAAATMNAVKVASKRHVNMVIGTTGIKQDNLDEIKKLAEAGKVGTVVASNFALGAVLMMHLAKVAAKYMDSVEIIELHHNTKVDAPSGTAITTAKSMAAARGKPFVRPDGTQASRGDVIDGVNVHSVRMPGLMAHQEVIFGASGQTLTIRHDTISRECYMPGVMLAVKEVVNRKGLVYGLDTLLNL